MLSVRQIARRVVLMVAICALLGIGGFIGYSGRSGGTGVEASGEYGQGRSVPPGVSRVPASNGVGNGIPAITPRGHGVANLSPALTEADVLNFYTVDDHNQPMGSYDGPAAVAKVQFVTAEEAASIMGASIGRPSDELVCLVTLTGHFKANTPPQIIATGTIMYQEFDAETGNFLGQGVRIQSKQLRPNVTSPSPPATP